MPYNMAHKTPRKSVAKMTVQVLSGSPNYTTQDWEQILVQSNGTTTFNITLPATPYEGSEVIIKDDLGLTSATAPINVLRNGQNIDGLASDFVISTAGTIYIFRYTAATGWRSEVYLRNIQMYATESEQSINVTGTAATINWNLGSRVVLNLTASTGNVTLTLQNPVVRNYQITVIDHATTPRVLTFPVGTVGLEGEGNTFVADAIGTTYQVVLDWSTALNRYQFTVVPNLA